jgi:hypothetical protein
MPTTDLFPSPSGTPIHPSMPRNLPGATPESTKVMRTTLKENHERYHILFNDRGFHNHTSHHIIALWALGAPADIVQKAFDSEKDSQRAIDHGVTPDVVPITHDNFFEHLGKHNYYQNYLKFFESAISSIGQVQVVEKYILSAEYNTPQGEMLNRYLSSLIHPFIHVGYGLEFDLPGMTAEGLALTAIQGANPAQDLYTSLAQSNQTDASGVLSTARNLAANLSIRGSVPASRETTPLTHALAFLTRIDADKEFKREPPPFLVASLYEKYTPKLREFLKEWIGDSSAQYSDAELQDLVWKKTDELVWLNTVIYAAGGTNSGAGAAFKTDFFTMHLVTSTLFLSSHVAKLSSPRQAFVLLQAFFVNSLLWYIALHEHPISISTFYTNTSKLIKPSTNKDQVNPWTEVISTSINHDDEHYPKLQRALIHFAALYGTKDFSDIFGSDSEKTAANAELKPMEGLDGSLFARAALASLDHILREKGGEDGKGTDGLGATAVWDGLDFIKRN